MHLYPIRAPAALLILAVLLLALVAAVLASRGIHIHFTGARAMYHDPPPGNASRVAAIAR